MKLFAVSGLKGLEKLVNYGDSLRQYGRITIFRVTRGIKWKRTSTNFRSL